MKHIVVLGSCLQGLWDLENIADLILTDPPYGIDYQSQRRTVKEKFDKFEGDLPGEWIDKFAFLSFRALKQDRHIYCFTRHDTYPLFWNAFKDAGFTMKRTLIWVKNNHGSGDLKGDYAPQDEWIIFAHKGRRELIGKRCSNILFYNKVHSDSLKHPTQKPYDLLKFLISKSMNPGEVVLDPFAGVLTTAYSAEQMGVDSISFDVEQSYLSIGIEQLKEAEIIYENLGERYKENNGNT